MIARRVVAQLYMESSVNAYTPERLVRWMSVSIQPEYLSLDHKVQDDIAWAADQIALLREALHTVVAVHMVDDDDMYQEQSADVIINVLLDEAEIFINGRK